MATLGGNMKKLISILLTLTLVFTISGCSAQKEELKAATEPIRVSILKGPTGMGMVKLMQDNEDKKTLNPYEFSMSATADEIVANITKGNLDIAAVPANLASALYNKTEGKISVAAINTLGVLYVVETGNEIKSIQDLKGKTIYSTGKGTTPEYALNYLLSQNKIDAQKDLTIEYKSEATEVAAMLSAAGDKNAIAVLPEPFVTVAKTKNDKLRTAVDFGQEWEKLNGEKLVTGVIIVNKAFLENNEDAFKLFMQEYKASTEFVNTNVEEAAKLVGKYEIVPEAVAKQAIPNCNITFIEKEELKTNLEAYLKVLFEQNPKAIGGKMPLEDFYYLG